MPAIAFLLSDGGGCIATFENAHAVPRVGDIFKHGFPDKYEVVRIEWEICGQSESEGYPGSLDVDVIVKKIE